MSAVRDLLLTAAVFAAAFTWFALQPRNLGPADESFFLLEAARIASGERLYRDIFGFTMPGAYWSMAGVFSLFGVSIVTAKLAMGAVNAATAALSVASARALGVRPVLAVLPALAFLALAQPAWPYVSQHWVSTALMVTLLWLAVPARALEQPGRLVAAGLVLGALGAVHQQKAPLMAAGLAPAILLAGWIRRDAAAPAWYVRLGLVAAGALLVLVPVVAVLLATVDATRLRDDIFRYPLTTYRQFVQAVRWGVVLPLTENLAAYVFPRLLAALPVLLPLGAAITAAGCRRGWSRTRVVQWSTTLLLCGAAALAIGYNDDFIHIAYVAVVFFVLAALLLETALALLPARAQPLAGALVAAVATAFLLLHLAHNTARMRAEYPAVADTRFGRVAFRAPGEIAMSAALERHLDQSGQRDVFVYPGYTSLYLTAAGRNPTRYQFLHPIISLPEHITEAIAALEAKQVPLVFVSKPFLQPGDPVMAYLATRYDVVEDHPDWAVYRRRAGAH